MPVLVGVAAFAENPDEGGCFVQDLNERRKIQPQFLRAQRRESIRRDAAQGARRRGQPFYESSGNYGDPLSRRSAINRPR